MKLVTYRSGRGAARVGALDGEVVFDLGALAVDLARERGAARHGRGGFPRTMLELIQRGPAALDEAREAFAHGQTVVGQRGADGIVAGKLGVAAKRARLQAPIPRPARNVFCLGRNYAEHAAERGAEVPKHPVYFTKAPESVVGPGAGVVHHTATSELDYEVELAAVIGTAGRDIARSHALGHVFGYTVVNDVTARDAQKNHFQFFKGKSLDTFCPIGPVVVTPDEFGDPQRKQVRLRVNGAVKQDASTAAMIFPVHVIVEWLSLGLTLEPGDIIATGTPDGVGFGRVPQEFLQDGDILETEVEGIGTMRNRIVIS
jgi:2-keto-4-pentenoate hydratase/2-oxohepta-3-ene-1,7-dioic acid hydratase in catechol pathway